MPGQPAIDGGRVHVPEPSRGVKRARLVLLLLLTGAAVTLLGWWASRDVHADLTPVLVPLAAVNVAMGMVACLGMRPNHLLVRSTGPMPGQLGRIVLVLLAEILGGFALYPLTDGDTSWFPAVTLAVLLLGLVAAVTGMLLVWAVVVPVWILVTRTPDAVRGDPRARLLVLLGAALVQVIAVATTIGLAVDVPGNGLRASAASFSPLVGLWPEGAVLRSDVWLWVSRGLVVTLLVTAFLLRRVKRPE
ncbi:MAG: hypothetical protein Q8Q02_04770 [Nocardioides sp.]|nr:hypothetical protein [Nocardioides sp.]